MLSAEQVEVGDHSDVGVDARVVTGLAVLDDHAEVSVESRHPAKVLSDLGTRRG